MIYKETKLDIIDNTVVKTVKCLSGIKAANFIGDIIVSSAQKTQPIKSKKKKLRLLKKGQILHVLILTTKSPTKRFGNIIYRSIKNTGCLVNYPDLTPIGSRLRGIIFRETSTLLPFRKLLSISEFIF